MHAPVLDVCFCEEFVVYVDVQVKDDSFSCLAAACLHSILQSATDLPAPAPSLDDICSALDCGRADQAEAVLQDVKAALKDDLSSTSVSGHIEGYRPLSDVSVRALWHIL